MKVCTDACLFGSLLPNGMGEIKNALDIGSGTGLLSLMYAQKNTNVIIDAIEIEKNAYEQTKENFSSSKWNDRLNIFHTDAKNFVSSRKYDLIICNPPFYENDLLSTETNKNLARHNKGLTLKELIAIIKNHLSLSGSFAILLPHNRIKYFENLAEENNFFLHEKLLIKQTPLHNFFRGILFLGYYAKDLKVKELTIKNREGTYTEDFTFLLKDYYLHF
jgi:tRNA1Val (adenine37-N6)-methyltransferase